MATVQTPFEPSAAGTEATVDDLTGAVAEALRRLGGGVEDVAGVGIAGIAESGAPLDAAGSPLAPVIAWHDRRGQDVAERISRQLGPDLAVRLGQELRYVASVAKLGWLLEHGAPPPARWLGVPELCLRALTGVHATEHSLASRTGCWDVGSRSWLPEVAEAAGFGVEVFAEIVAAGVPMGRVSPESASWSGLPAGTPVTLAGHDHFAGVIGSGAEPADLANSVGTAETVVGRMPELPDRARAVGQGLAVSVFPGGDGWAVLASAARAGLAVGHASRALGRPAAELDDLAEGEDPLDAPRLAESLARRDPPVLPDGRPGQVWSALLHALAAGTAEAVAKVTGLLGPKPRLVVYGGGASSRPWLAAKAAAVPIPLWRSTAVEAVARGAAIVAGVATGWWESPASGPVPALEPITDEG